MVLGIFSRGECAGLWELLPKYYNEKIMSKPRGIVYLVINNSKLALLMISS
jgi:hypothetical protein